ncbi:MAG: hypothetical protein OXC48_12560, partial [Endozoicomonadaceae bacterium]|nr:hypothetical protein [Endozoicomonadaceae bacterium]
GCTVATLGAAAAGAGTAALAGVVAGTAAIGSIPVVAAAIPANRGVNAAGSIIGMAEMAVSVAVGISGLLPFAITNEEAEAVPMFMIPKMLRLKPGEDEAEENISTIATGSSGATATLVSATKSLTLTDAETTVQSLSELSFFSNYDYVFPQRFRMNSPSDVVKVWTSLRNTKFIEAINCDVGVILLAHMLTGETLDIKTLDEFLYVRNQYLEFEEEITSEHPYIAALYKALDKTLSYISDIEFYHVGDLIHASIRYNKYLLIQGYAHTAILKAAGFDINYHQLFDIYQFYGRSRNDELKLEAVTIDALASRVFPYPNKEKKLVFLRYAVLK